MTILGSSAKLAISSVAKKLAARLPSARTTELFNEMVQDAALTTEGFILKLVERIGGDPEEVISRLASAVTEKEQAAFSARLLPEVVGSPTEDRRRLMAAALAGVFHPDFSLEEKSRITRAISMLEPSDVVFLRSLQRLTLRVPVPVAAEIEKLYAPAFRPSSVRVTAISALVAASCLRELTGKIGTPEHELTPLGRSVLEYLVDWEPYEGVSTNE